MPNGNIRQRLLIGGVLARIVALIEPSSGTRPGRETGTSSDDNGVERKTTSQRAKSVNGFFGSILIRNVDSAFSAIPKLTEAQKPLARQLTIGGNCRSLSGNLRGDRWFTDSAPSLKALNESNRE